MLWKQWPVLRVQVGRHVTVHAVATAPDEPADLQPSNAETRHEEQGGGCLSSEAAPSVAALQMRANASNSGNLPRVPIVRVRRGQPHP